jgi:hypothetical protein
MLMKNPMVLGDRRVFRPSQAPAEASARDSLGTEKTGWLRERIAFEKFGLPIACAIRTKNLHCRRPRHPVYCLTETCGVSESPGSTSASEVPTTIAATPSATTHGKIRCSVGTRISSFISNITPSALSHSRTTSVKLPSAMHRSCRRIMPRLKRRSRLATLPVPSPRRIGTRTKKTRRWASSRAFQKPFGGAGGHRHPQLLQQLRQIPMEGVKRVLQGNQYPQ